MGRHPFTREYEERSLALGALHWLLEHYTASPMHDREVARIINKVLHEDEPRMIASDVKRFHRYYLDRDWP